MHSGRGIDKAAPQPPALPGFARMFFQATIRPPDETEALRKQWRESVRAKQLAWLAEHHDEDLAALGICAHGRACMARGVMPTSRAGRPLPFEFHHIRPLGLGGDNSADNLIFMARKDHAAIHEELEPQLAGRSPGERVEIVMPFPVPGPAGGMRVAMPDTARHSAMLRRLAHARTGEATLPESSDEETGDNLRDVLEQACREPVIWKDIVQPLPWFRKLRNRLEILRNDADRAIEADAHQSDDAEILVLMRRRDRLHWNERFLRLHIINLERRLQDDEKVGLRTRMAEIDKAARRLDDEALAIVEQMQDVQTPVAEPATGDNDSGDNPAGNAEGQSRAMNRKARKRARRVEEEERKRQAHTPKKVRSITVHSASLSTLVEIEAILEKAQTRIDERIRSALEQPDPELERVKRLYEERQDNRNDLLLVRRQIHRRRIDEIGLQRTRLKHESDALARRAARHKTRLSSVNAELRNATPGPAEQAQMAIAEELKRPRRRKGNRHRTDEALPVHERMRRDEQRRAEKAERARAEQRRNAEAREMRRRERQFRHRQSGTGATR